MVKHLYTISLAVALITLGAGDLRVQAQPQKQEGAPTEPQTRKPGIPLQVHVVISRSQGEKKISSVPYTIAVNAGVPPFHGRASQLRVGARVPVSTVMPRNSFNYEQLGTSMDCSVAQTEDGRFNVYLTIAETSLSVAGPGVQGATATGNEPPIFRTFSSTNELTLRDGQSTQFTAATDRISGEVTRVDVTLNVVK